MAFQIKKISSFLLIFSLSLLTAIAIASCSSTIADDYQAKAQTTLTWRVFYSIDPHEAEKGRYQEFESNSLTIINGERPKLAYSGPDDEGLWWPAIPPKPSLDEIEAAAKSYEKFDRPELLRTVKYRVIFTQDGERLNLPTNYSAYRQIVKASRENKRLRFTLGINNGSVEKAAAID